MNKTLLIFRHEFFKAVRKPGFIVMTLFIPLAALAGIGFFSLISDGAAVPPPPSGEPTMAPVIVPGIFSLLMALALTMGSASLIGGLAEEKESRLVEVLFSSTSVGQLLTGKVVALGLAGVLQVLVWLISLPLLVNLAASTFGGFLSAVSVPVNFVLLGIIYFILGYLLFAVFSIGLGAISTSVTEGNQLSMIYTLTSYIPLWFFAVLNFFPTSPIWVALSIFPVTAPIQIMVRLGFYAIPLWQILTSIGVLIISIVVGMAVAIRVFRLYMLMAGKRPTLGEIYRGLREA